MNKGKIDSTGKENKKWREWTQFELVSCLFASKRRSSQTNKFHFQKFDFFCLTDLNRIRSEVTKSCVFHSKDPNSLTAF